MTAISTMARVSSISGAAGLASPSLLNANKINSSNLVATRSLSGQSTRATGASYSGQYSLALNKPAPSSVRMTGSMVLGQLYGQSKPAGNLLEGFLGGLSNSEYATLSRRFMNIASDVGLKVYRNDGLIAGDGVAVHIPTTEEGGRMLVRALARFDQVDDKVGGNQAVQQSALPLIKSMGLDKSKSFMKGVAAEAKALQLPWQLQAMLALQTLLGMVPAGVRGFNPNAVGSPRTVVVRNKPTPGSGTGPGRNPVLPTEPYRAPAIAQRASATKPQRGVVSAASTSSTAGSSATTVRPAAVLPPASPARLTSALRVSAVSSNLRSIENPKRFDTYINNLNGQSMLTVGRVGVTGVTIKDVSLATRRQVYQTIKASSLELGNSPKVDTGEKHDWHLAFGTPSKLGESHASGSALRLGLKTSWAERGQLPGQGGKKIEQFWRADVPSDYKVADQALSRLESLAFDGKLKTLGFKVTEPLSQTGFIPQGSALSMRLERLERAVQTQNTLAAEFSKADPSAVPALLPKLNAANTAVEASIKQLTGQAVQTRSELLAESLGTPKTTYELTVRYATTARYMQSIEGQPNPIFDAAKFKQIMAAVKAEAGPEGAVSLKWHREFVRTQARDSTFKEAMKQSPAMEQAWESYKAKYGI